MKKFLTFLSIIIIFSGCRKDIELQKKSTENSSVITSVYGRIEDESGNPIQGAVVTTLSGSQTVTDKNGLFTLNNVSSNKERLYVKAKKEGYFPGSRSVIPNNSGSTQIKIKLQSDAPAFSYNSSASASHTLTNGASIFLPENGVVNENGTAYSGIVNVSFRHLDPDDESFSEIMPGNLEAIRENGSATYLLSYGMLNVELKGNAGQPLQLAPGVTSILTFPVPESMKASTPGSIPLWYFDEEKGIWKEEGEALLTGNKYVGKVKHFTTWNLDIPEQRLTIFGKVIDCNGNPVEGMIIKTGQTMTITNSSGEYSNMVLANARFHVSFSSKLGFGSVAREVGPFNAGSQVEIPVIQIPCPAKLKGNIVDCDNNPVSGIVFADWVNGYSIVNVSQGQFSISVFGDEEITLTAIGINQKSSPAKVITSPSSGFELDLGTIEVCDEILRKNMFVINGGIYNDHLVLFDDSYCGAEYHSQWNVVWAWQQNGPMTNTFMTSFSFIGNTPGEYKTPDDGMFNLSFPGRDTTDVKMNIKVIKFEDPGGVIEGTYEGTANKDGINYQISRGRFSFRRQF